jgi:hypothetical protein
MTTPPADGMPTTRGTNFYLVDPNLAFVCASVMLYHALAGALLAGGERLWRERRSARKLLAASLYLRRWLRPPPPPASAFTAREGAWLPALVDWTAVPAEALAEPAGGG